MIIHSDLMFVLSPASRLRWMIPDDSYSSFFGQSCAVTELATLLHHSGLE